MARCASSVRGIGALSLGQRLWVYWLWFIAVLGSGLVVAGARLPDVRDSLTPAEEVAFGPVLDYITECDLPLTRVSLIETGRTTAGGWYVRYECGWTPLSVFHVGGTLKCANGEW